MSSETDRIWKSRDRVRFTEETLPAFCRIDDFLPLIPIGRSTLWFWVRRGLFPKPFKRGGKTLWHREDILKWLELIP